jgi:endonuclease-3
MGKTYRQDRAQAIHRSASLKGLARALWLRTDLYESFMPEMTRENARKIFERLAAIEAAPQTELYFTNPFTLVVAVALSAQATDVGVNKATKDLFKIAGTPAKMAALGEKKLGGYIKTIGLWRNKAKNVIALSRKIIDDFGGEVPQTREELETLPGVGRKTANVVMNVAFGAPAIAVDTHIFRVGNRTGLAPGKTPLEVELGLEKIVPAEFMLHAHHWLILHGRYVCKARKPECWRCEIAQWCSFKEKVLSPNPPKKAKPKPAAKKKSTPK